MQREKNHRSGFVSIATLLYCIIDFWTEKLADDSGESKTGFFPLITTDNGMNNENKLNKMRERKSEQKIEKRI